MPGITQKDKNQSLLYGRQKRNQEGGRGYTIGSFQSYLWRILDIRGKFLRVFALLRYETKLALLLAGWLVLYKKRPLHRMAFWLKVEVSNFLPVF